MPAAMLSTMLCTTQNTMPTAAAMRGHDAKDDGADDTGYDVKPDAEDDAK